MAMKPGHPIVASEINALISTYFPMMFSAGFQAFPGLSFEGASGAAVAMVAMGAAHGVLRDDPVTDLSGVPYDLLNDDLYVVPKTGTPLQLPSSWTLSSKRQPVPSDGAIFAEFGGNLAVIKSLYRARWPLYGSPFLTMRFSISGNVGAFHDTPVTVPALTLTDSLSAAAGDTTFAASVSLTGDVGTQTWMAVFTTTNTVVSGDANPFTTTPFTTDPSGVGGTTGGPVWTIAGTTYPGNPFDVVTVGAALNGLGDLDPTKLLLAVMSVASL